MLIHLSIQNYALIEKVEINFSQELNIITGETGAGKSILLGALALIAGERADSSLLQDKTQKCIVEGSFNIKSYPLKPFFSVHNLDYADKTVIRREISPEGKSRAFINDTPVTLAQLKELSRTLIDIHSQHETLSLNDTIYQLSVIDAYALKNNSKILTDYKTLYKTYKDSELLLINLQEQERKTKMDIGYWQFQFDELHRMNLQAKEQEKAEEELKILENAEEIKSTLNKFISLLIGTEHTMGNGNAGILPLLNESKAQLNSIAALNAGYEELRSRLSSVYIELKDIALEAENFSENISFNPERVKELTERLDAIYGLQDKHRINSVEQLIEEKEKIETKLKNNSSLEEKISLLQKKVMEMQSDLFKLAKQVSAERSKAIPALEKEITILLASLAMPNARFKIEHIVLETFTDQGIDKIKFLFSANKGSDIKEISRVASGGELSRLMLCIKSIMARSALLPTVVFDEIDTGVSGSIADQMGKMILNMSCSMQVLVITHLPQIAGKGNFHLSVYKEEKANKTFTRICSLTKEERIDEIAKMLSAGKPTEASLKNAKELLKE